MTSIVDIPLGGGFSFFLSGTKLTSSCSLNNLLLLCQLIFQVKKHNR